MRILRFMSVGFAFISGQQALAQAAPPPPTSAPSVPSMPLPELRMMDERMTDFERLNHEVNRRTPGATRSSTPVPAHPDDIVPGLEVRDSRGVVMATVDSVGMAYAVLTSPVGRIEVEFESFAKTNKGIMINMTKKKFDSIVAGAAKAK